MTDEPLLVAGRIGRPHGLDGSFHVTRPRPALLVLGGTVRIGACDHEIERRSGTDARPILRLAGVSSREALDALRDAYPDIEVTGVIEPGAEAGRAGTVAFREDRQIGRADAAGEARRQWRRQVR